MLENLFYICMDDIAEEMREEEGKKIEIYCHLQEFILRRTFYWETILQGSLVFLHVLQVEAVSVYTQMCFQGCMYSIQPQKTKISSPF